MAENPFSSPSTIPKTDVQITSLTIIVASLFLFLTLIFLSLLYFYSKHYYVNRSISTPPPRLIFPCTLALHPSILASLPITPYNPTDFNDDGLECSVCLSDLAPGDEARLLPKCGHGFHRQCIDAWFRSNSTCPICRCVVVVEGSDGSTAVDARGEEGGSGTSGGRALVISVPVRSAEGVFSDAMSEKIRSPPVTPKVWSLRRILSGGVRIGDVERGMVGGAEEGEGSSSSSLQVACRERSLASCENSSSFAVRGSIL